MTEFTPWMSLAGGALIGLAALLLMAGLGRIAGMTGILAGVLPRAVRDIDWRLAFLAGAVLAPWLLGIAGVVIPFAVPVSSLPLAIGGVVVGVGATLGSGCTSGHGVCGNARGSIRSVAATLTFMATTAITVYVLRHVLGA